MERSNTRRAPHASTTDIHCGESCGVQGKKHKKNITIRSSVTATGERLATPKAQP
jgi:hypothetical protein